MNDDSVSEVEVNKPVTSEDASFLSKSDQKPTRAWLKPLFLGAGLGIAIALAFFLASLTLVPLIPKGFVDDGDFGISNVSIELPPGSTLQDVNKVVT